MARDFDQTAVFSLLVRQVEAQDQERQAEQEILRLQEAVLGFKAIKSGVRAALKVYGFDMAAEEPWKAVREFIGDERWGEAFDIARPIKPSTAEDQETSDGSYQDKSNVDDGAADEGSKSDENGISAISGKNIKEIIQEQLSSVWPSGLKASDFKAFLATQNIETHEKTVGMTLYRLSKEHTARREGRTWFFVPSADQNEAADDLSSAAPISQQANPLPAGSHQPGPVQGQERQVVHDNMK